MGGTHVWLESIFVYGIIAVCCYRPARLSRGKEPSESIQRWGNFEPAATDLASSMMIHVQHRLNALRKLAT